MTHPQSNDLQCIHRSGCVYATACHQAGHCTSTTHTPPASNLRLDIGAMLAFIRQSIFSKRFRFYEALQKRAEAYLPGARPAWPDALNLLTDEDWIAAYRDIDIDGAVSYIPSAVETPAPLPQMIAQQRERIRNQIESEHCGHGQGNPRNCPDCTPEQVKTSSEPSV